MQTGACKIGENQARQNQLKREGKGTSKEAAVGGKNALEEDKE